LFPFAGETLCGTCMMSAEGSALGANQQSVPSELRSFVWLVAAGEDSLGTRSSVRALSGSGSIGADASAQGNGAPSWPTM